MRSGGPALMLSIPPATINVSSYLSYCLSWTIYSLLSRSARKSSLGFWVRPAIVHGAGTGEELETSSEPIIELANPSAPIWAEPSLIEGAREYVALCKEQDEVPRVGSGASLIIGDRLGIPFVASP